jgi:NAD(P)-dependent dehydrogenase (short-subunit alcohol dehydrogenase family)
LILYQNDNDEGTVMDLSNSVALVTGAGSGMGHATAKLLAESGVRVALLDIHAGEIESLAKELDGFAIQCDVSDSLRLGNAFIDLEAHFGIPNICINCAGIATGQLIIGKDGPMPLEDFRRVVEINLIGTFNVLRLAAFAMSQLKPESETDERGVIINTSSVAAFEGQIGQSAYSASKGAVAAMTLPIARELAKYHIRMVSIAPGVFETPMIANMPEKVQHSLMNSVVFPNRFGKPEEYAKLVMHILDNPMINGEVIRLDGAVRLGAK